MSDLAKKLGRRIYGFRKQGGLTQAALAEKCKISNEFMSAVERGAKLPSLDVLARIAVGLSVEIKDLFDFDRTPFRRLEPLPRNVTDVATEIAVLPPSRRRRALKMLRIINPPYDSLCLLNARAYQPVRPRTALRPTEQIIRRSHM